MIIDFTKLASKFKLHITGVVHVGAHVGQEYEVYKKIRHS